jgi:hypothetical protein
MHGADLDQPVRLPCVTVEMQRWDTRVLKDADAAVE